eukprot:SAG11_NODE_56_length_19295_cov_20.219675_8_plen_281_part_00
MAPRPSDPIRWCALRSRRRHSVQHHVRVGLHGRKLAHYPFFRHRRQCEWAGPFLPSKQPVMMVMMNLCSPLRLHVCGSARPRGQCHGTDRVHDQRPEPAAAGWAWAAAEALELSELLAQRHAASRDPRQRWEDGRARDPALRLMPHGWQQRCDQRRWHRHRAQAVRAARPSRPVQSSGPTEVAGEPASLKHSRLPLGGRALSDLYVRSISMRSAGGGCILSVALHSTFLVMRIVIDVRYICVSLAALLLRLPRSPYFLVALTHSPNRPACPPSRTCRGHR